MTVGLSSNHSTLYNPYNNQTLEQVKLLRQSKEKEIESELIKQNKKE
jgi:hypothetical protein